MFIFAQAADSLVLNTPTGDLYGTLLTPKTDQKVPVVLFIVGSGPTDRDGNSPYTKNNSLKFLAEALQEKGIASLRYDKRGIAQSSKALDSVQNLRLDTWVQDAKDWVHLLQKRNQFSTITILGHSQGSLVGMLAAQDSAVNKYISAAGAGAPINEILETQLAANSPLVLGAAKPILDSLAAGYLVQQVPPMLQSLFAPQVQPFLISWMKYDPAKAIKKLDIPCLIIQGNTDLQVSVKDAQNLKDANPKAQLLIIDQMNHLFKQVSDNRAENMKTYTNPDLPVMPKFVDGIVQFVKDR